MEETERKVEIELRSLESQESIKGTHRGNGRRPLLLKEIQGRNSKNRNFGWLILFVLLVSLFVATAYFLDEEDLFSSRLDDISSYPINNIDDSKVIPVDVPKFQSQNSTNQTQVTNETTFTSTQPQSGPSIQTESPSLKTDILENPPPNHPYSPTSDSILNSPTPLYPTVPTQSTLNYPSSYSTQPPPTFPPPFPQLSPPPAHSPPSPQSHPPFYSTQPPPTFPPPFPQLPPPPAHSPPSPSPSFVSDSAPPASLQLVEGNNSTVGMTPVITEERIEIIRHDTTTDRLQLVGDVRVDASRNLVVLYATKPETNRTVLATKPQPRVWDKPAMERVTEIVIKSINRTADLDPWKISSDLPPEDPLWKQLQETNIIVNEGENPFEFLVNLGESKEWSEESWNILRSQRLPEKETQLTFIEKIRETMGKKLVSQGGRLEMNWKRSWIAFSKGDLVSFEDAKKDSKGPRLKCDVTHKVPGIIFSGGGFLGNIFHDFNDALIPLYLTVQQFKGEVVFLIEDLNLYWIDKYELLLRQLSAYPIVLLGREKYNHCFLDLKSGLDFHDILFIDSDKLAKQKIPGSFADFQSKMAKAWDSEEEKPPKCQPVITLIQRTGTRMITNIEDLRKVAEDLGFLVDVFSPSGSTPMVEVWRRIRSADAMIAVHGAAMTYFLYLKEKSTLVQIVPIGLPYFADIFYAHPAEKMGLKYLKYLVQYEESSLKYKYSKDDPVVSDFTVVIKDGWEKLKEIYLENQNVTLDIGRFGDLLKDLKEDIKSNPNFIKRMENCDKNG